MEKVLNLVNKVKLTKGARIIFIGDSLTAHFPGRNYSALISRALKWRFGYDVEVINAGVGGDNILKIAKRLKRDVIDKKPTHIFIFEGANDCKRPYRSKTDDLGNWNIPPEKYEVTYRDVIKTLKDRTDAKIIIATCAPGNKEISDSFAKDKKLFGIGGNLFCLPTEVARIIAIQKKIAKDFNVEVLDTNKQLRDYMANRKKTGGNEYINVDDGVHLSDYGNREVAWIFLEYLTKE